MRLLLAGLIAVCGASSARADIIAVWNFNGYDGDSTTISASTGSGLMSITGFSAGDLGVFVGAGSTFGLAPGDVAGDAITFATGSPLNNGDYFDLIFSGTSFTDIELTMAYRRDAFVSFNADQWSWSITGLPGSFTDEGAALTTTGPSPYSTAFFDFTAVPTLDNVSTVFLRYTFNGATAAGARDILDNIIITGTFEELVEPELPGAAPEPSSLALAGFGLLALAGYTHRRRRKSSSPADML